MAFIGILPLQSGQMSGFDARKVPIRLGEDNSDFGYWVYACSDEIGDGMRVTGWIGVAPTPLVLLSAIRP
jgi:hypothetical protein